jgi:hypothetical protein
MKKPSIYLDTSVISAYWYEGADVAVLASRLQTREWWDLERHHFTLWASAVSETELLAGDFPRQGECLAMVRRLSYVATTSAVRTLAREILECRIVPENKPADAAHLALSAIHGIDYLLTWNYAHMANPIAQEKLAELCEREGIEAPLMVSPESIPQVRFGKTIRRRR